MMFSSEEIIVFFFLGLLLVSTTIFDLKFRKIPNMITFPGMLIALVYHSVAGGMEGFLFSIAGTFTGIGLLIIPYILGGMGAGDAKLMGAVGAMLGAGGVLNAFFYVAATGGGYLLLLLLFKKRKYGIYFMRHFIMLKAFLYTGKFFHVPAKTEEIQASKVSYGAIIAIGTLVYLSLQISGRNPIHL